MKAPPGFQAYSSEGDGNCFYYSLSQALSDFKGVWSKETVELYKKFLLESLKTSQVLKVPNTDQLVIDQVRERLQTEGSFAEYQEIKLSAEALKLCIYVITPSSPRNHAHWNVYFHASPEYRAKNPTCPDYKFEVPAASLRRDAILCNGDCGRFKPLFLLLDVDGIHYSPMKLLDPEPSEALVSSKETTSHSLLHSRTALGSSHSPKPEPRKIVPPPPALKPEPAPKGHARSASPRSPKRMFNTGAHEELTARVSSPPKKFLQRENTIRKYLNLIREQLDLVNRFMQHHGTLDEDLQGQYRRLSGQWIDTALKLFKEYG